MNQFQIETAQNVGINQNAAHIGDRMLGYLIDSLVILFYTISIFLLLSALDLSLGDAWAIYLLVSLPAFLYYVLLETFFNGKTVGKLIVQTRVVKIDGSKASFANYFVRWILRIIDVVITFGGFAVLTILIKGNGQRLGDIAAGTTVITEKESVSIDDTILKEIPLDYIPKYSQVTVLNDSDMQMIKNIYNDAIFNSNHAIVIKISRRLEDLMKVEAKESPTNFVATVIKDYNYYTQKM
jgi:uncharacterized RDD family membrane protein YckC